MVNVSSGLHLNAPFQADKRLRNRIAIEMHIFTNLCYSAQRRRSLHDKPHSPRKTICIYTYFDRRVFRRLWNTHYANDSRPPPDPSTVFSATHAVTSFTKSSKQYFVCQTTRLVICRGIETGDRGGVEVLKRLWDRRSKRDMQARRWWWGWFLAETQT